MEIQRNISVTMRRKLSEYRNQEEFAQDLGVGHTTVQNLLAGRGNPNAETIELLARGMGITLAQLVSGELIPADRAFNLISELVDVLHPTLQEAGAIQLEALRQLFRLSEERCTRDPRWRYSVTEPRPFLYGLKATENTERAGPVACFESRVFTDDRHIAQAAADLFTRNSLSPIHLEEAIEDYLKSL